MAGKKVIWEFDEKEEKIFVSDKSTGAHVEEPFSFILKRYKDADTKEEHLEIKCKYNEEDNGTVSTYIYNLSKDLKEFLKYGIAFSNTIYNDLEMEIRKHYLELKRNDIEKVHKDADMQSIFDMICEVIKTFDDGATEEYYNIPVEQFNSLIEESKYSKKYDLITIKKWFMNEDNQYIKCGKGRLSNIVRIKGKPTRVISFYREKIDKRIEEIIKKDAEQANGVN